MPVAKWKGKNQLYSLVLDIVRLPIENSLQKYANTTTR